MPRVATPWKPEPSTGYGKRRSAVPAPVGQATPRCDRGYGCGSAHHSGHAPPTGTRTVGTRVHAGRTAPPRQGTPRTPAPGVRVRAGQRTDGAEDPSVTATNQVRPRVVRAPVEAAPTGDGPCARAARPGTRSRAKGVRAAPTQEAPRRGGARRTRWPGTSGRPGRGTAVPDRGPGEGPPTQSAQTGGASTPTRRRPGCRDL